MSVLEKLNVPYDGIAICCGDGAYSMAFILYLMKEYERKKTDLLPMPGGSRAFSGYEEEGHELTPKNRDRLAIMREAMFIGLATYLDHGGNEIHICDHLKCGFWFDYKWCNDAARAAQIASMWRVVRIIQEFIRKIKEDAQFAERYVVNPKNIKVEKFVLHYATLNEGGDLEKIEKVGELSIVV